MLAARRSPVLSLAAAMAAIAGFASALAHPDDVIGRSFATAFQSAKRPVQGPSVLKADAGASVTDQGFDPAFLHFSTHHDVSNASRSAMALGDRISISGADGIVRAYEVVDVSELPASGVAGHDADAPATRLLLVTAHMSGAPDRSGSAGVMRFVVEAGDRDLTPPQAKRRAL